MSQPSQYSQNDIEREIEKDKLYREKRRNLRQKYHNLIEATIQSKRELIQPGTQKLKEVIEKGNELFKEITHAREGAIDAQWFKQASMYTLEQSNKIVVGKTWDIDDFITKLKSKYSNSQNEIDWMAMGKDVAKYYRRTPPLTFMYGPIKIEQKQTQRKRRKKKEVEAQVVNPETIDHQKQSENEVAKKVQHVYKKLKKSEKKQGGSVPFYNIVINPNSFTKTIENVFYYSFLIKDGNSKLELNDEGEIVASTATVPNINEMKEGKGENKQAVLKFDLATYKKLVEKLQNRGNKRKREEEEEEESSPKKLKK